MSLMEKLEKARENLDLSIQSQEDIVKEELLDNVEQPDIIESVKTQGASGTQDVVQLYQLVNDFEFIRETLRENQQNGRRVLRSIAQDIMDSEEDLKASLILSFQELNKAIQENIKLYMFTYKTITETLKNIQTIQKNQGVQETEKQSSSITENISTQDIIARIRSNK